MPGDDKSQAVKIATPHKQVLMQGGGPSDLPGVHYKLISGWPSMSILSKILTPPRRKSSRAKYGIKNHTRTLQVSLRMYKKRMVIKKKLFN